ncbi:hypothetical protein C7M84_009584 [Penaeus vannamei]|uniref:Uncharacterized protein n=1 Tax=Penaeus vannamei TaxID=6689 RepID=A0A3R7PHK4_PENVA|nr:hypothetical protein C7M84_009584 [Penaeus vannamei]
MNRLHTCSVDKFRFGRVLGNFTLLCRVGPWRDYAVQLVAERSAAGKRDVRPSVCASLPRAVAGRARAGESVGELAPLRVTLESPWRILHRGILIPVTGHRPQCLLALARSKQVPSCDTTCDRLLS